MLWQLLAIWAIIGVTLVWFIRDERRVPLERYREQARRFALDPAFRHQPAPDISRRIVAQGSDVANREARRRFIAAMQR